MFSLMNKDNCVARFSIVNNGIEEKITLLDSDKDKVPIGFSSIKEWIEQRKGSKHNRHLKELMISCGCNNAEGFIKVTHATSINDTFWVKSDSESVSWNDVSLYKNKFNEVISKLAFEGIGLYGIELSTSSPELSTEGSFRKCWRREADEIYLYKRGSFGARNSGLEPYCETLASELASKICKNSVSYDVVKLHGQVASKCKLFTNEQVGYVPIVRYLSRNCELSDFIKFYENLGSEDDFRRMAVLDAVTFNVDRHMGNHGVLIDNDTLQPIKMAPVFDMNMAMLPYLEKDDFANLGTQLQAYAPLIGTDFTRVGQHFLTPGIRSDLINLKGYEFNFRGNADFPETRVKAMEKIINRQIEAVLSKDILYTKDVFVPAPVEIKKSIDLSEEIERAEQIGNKIVTSLGKTTYSLNEHEDHIELVFCNREISNAEIYVNINDFSMWVEVDGIETDLCDCVMNHPPVATWYTEISEIIDNSDIFYEREQKIEHDNSLNIGR